MHPLSEEALPATVIGLTIADVSGGRTLLPIPGKKPTGGLYSFYLATLYFRREPPISRDHPGGNDPTGAKS